MEQLEPFDGARVTSHKGVASSGEIVAGQWSAGSLSKDIGAAGRPQILDQAIQAGVADVEPIDIDHRLNQADRAKQCGQGWPIDGRVNARRRAASSAIGGEHCRPKSGQAVTADNRPEQQTAWSEQPGQYEGVGGKVVAGLQLAD